MVQRGEPTMLRSPRFRRLARERGHQFHQAAPVPAPHGMLDGDQGLHRRARRLGLVFSHGGSLADPGRPVIRGNKSGHPALIKVDANACNVVADLDSIEEHLWKAAVSP